MQTDPILPGQWSCACCGRVFAQHQSVFGCVFCLPLEKSREWDTDRAKAWHAKNSDEHLFL